MVHKDYLDIPCVQNRPPIVKNDPQAISNPRLAKDYIDPESRQVLPNKELENKLNNEHWRSFDEAVHE